MDLPLIFVMPTLRKSIFNPSDIKEKLLNVNTFFKNVCTCSAATSIAAGSIFMAAVQAAAPAAAVAAVQPAPTVPASAMPTFGSVNVEQVLSESSARKKDSDDLNAMLTNLRNVNTRLQQGAAVFLNEAEMRELSGLYEKEAPNDTDKKRIAQLELTCDTRKRELASLESTPQPSDDQRRRYNELGAMKQQGEQNMQQLGQDFQERLRKHEEELTTKTIAVIKDGIATVAKSRGLSVVFDSKVAIYTSNDVTADVIKQVNK